MNISAPKVDEHYSLLRTHELFRSLGLRHLVVTDMHNCVVGIITRKDIMQFNVIEKIKRFQQFCSFFQRGVHQPL